MISQKDLILEEVCDLVSLSPDNFIELPGVIRNLIRKSEETHSYPVYIHEDINPWAEQTARGLQESLHKEVDNIRRGFLENYHPTLEALKSAGEEGFTSEEVSKITKRRKNTESGYLYRLYLAGFISRVRKGNKIKYILKDKSVIDMLKEGIL